MPDNEKVLFFDTETTGLPKPSLSRGDKAQPHTIQLAFLLAIGDLNANNGAYWPLMEQCCIIKMPSNVTSHPKAFEAHKIPDKVSHNHGISPNIVYPAFRCALSHASLQVAHNYDFDVQLMNIGFSRQLKDAHIIMDSVPSLCTMKKTTGICKISFPSGGRGYKWPTLEELHKFLFGESFEGAHDALVDVRATARCYFELKRRGLL